MNFLRKITEGWESFFNAIHYRSDPDFWEDINIGWYREYIFPYDDTYSPFISKERRLRLAQKSPSIHKK